jgi:predicted glycosyltransferase
MKKKKQKKIVFDIHHVAHLNLFSHVIRQYYEDEDKEVFIVGLRRQSLPKIIHKELGYIGDKNIKMIGSWKPNKWGIIVQSNILRLIGIFFYLLKIKPDVGISSGGLPFSLSLKLLNKPALEFCDDPDRKFQLKLELFGATKKYYPFFVKMEHPKIETFHCLKQWSYLTPREFTPDSSVLKKHGVEEKKYFFVREVSTASLNYADQRSGIVSTFADRLPKEYKVLLSLENKAESHLYPEDWIILQEPVEDIHSLIYYSRLLIASGDSMAREGAILGVPSIYCGKRIMGANGVMIEEGKLFKTDPEEVPAKVEALLKEDLSETVQNNFRTHLNQEWDDLNEFINNKVNLYLKD